MSATGCLTSWTSVSGSNLLTVPSPGLLPERPLSLSPLQMFAVQTPASTAPPAWQNPPSNSRAPVWSLTRARGVRKVVVVTWAAREMLLFFLLDFICNSLSLQSVLKKMSFLSHISARNICMNVNCGRGDCVVNLNKPPFYECKCRPPYQGPNCNQCKETGYMGPCGFLTAAFKPLYV